MLQKNESGREFSPFLRSVHLYRPEDIPAVDERIVDVAILDMNHNWPNLGLDSMLDALDQITRGQSAFLQATSMSLRVLSYDVRRSLMIPEPPGGRFQLYLGTGGPGHIDPHQNDGISDGTQGIREDPSWEDPLFDLLGAIKETDGAALLAVCHTFGVLCRWGRIARPVLRGPEKGGKSTGVVENILTPEALCHPWFSRLGAKLLDGRRIRIVDNRLYDLIPGSRSLPPGMTPIGYETAFPGGPVGEALTMLELARDRGGVMPRMFAVNHHPEVVDRRRQRLLLEQKFSRGEVSVDWYQERLQTLTQVSSNPENERLIHLTSQYAFLMPLRFHLYRHLRLRAESLGYQEPFHENQILEAESETLAGCYPI